MPRLIFMITLKFMIDFEKSKRKSTIIFAALYLWPRGTIMTPINIIVIIFPRIPPLETQSICFLGDSRHNGGLIEGPP